MFFKARTVLLAAVVTLGFAGTALADMTIYDHRGFQGKRYVVTGDISDLDDIDFNNKVSAVIVRSGRWTLYRDDEFAGDSITLGPGQYPDLEKLGFRRNVVSSIRALDEGEVTVIPPPPGTGGAVALAMIGGCGAGEVLAPVIGNTLEYECMQAEDAPLITIESSNGGRCIEAGSTESGYRVRLRHCADMRKQKLGLAASPSLPAGSFVLFAYDDSCLSATAQSPGSPVGLATCTATATQVWTPASADGTASRLIGANGLCLTAASIGGSDMGVRLDTCNGGQNQRWVIRRVEAD